MIGTILAMVRTVLMAVAFCTPRRMRAKKSHRPADEIATARMVSPEPRPGTPSPVSVDMMKTQ